MNPRELKKKRNKASRQARRRNRKTRHRVSNGAIEGGRVRGRVRSNGAIEGGEEIVLDVYIGRRTWMEWFEYIRYIKRRTDEHFVDAEPVAERPWPPLYGSRPPDLMTERDRDSDLSFYREGL